ncbi:MAG: MFS transporter [Pseudomonadota bacterium]
MTQQPVHHRPLCPEGRGARAPEASAPCAEASRPFVLAATILASAMAFIDGSIVTIALPSIQSDLNAGFSGLQWVVNAYALFLGGLILIGGALGDRVGRRRIFVWGLVLFAIASVGCAVAPNLEALVTARALKGAGAALLVPQSLAIIAASFPKAVRGKAIGLWAAASAITTAMGPPLGGILIDAFDWRAIFWINLPLAAIAVLLTVRHVPESRAPQSGGAVDYWGALFAVGGFGALTLGLTWLGDPEATGPTGAIVAGLGVALLGAFIIAEHRAAAALVPLSLFRDPVFSAVNIFTVLLYGAFSAVLFLLPFELIARRGLSATDVGLVLLPLGLIIGVFARFAGSGADRFGVRPFLTGGAALVTLGAALLSLSVESLLLGIVAPIVLMSFGMALVVAPLSTAVINSAPDAMTGAASGISNAASRVAGLVAIAGIGALANAFFAVATAEIGTQTLRFGTLPEAGSSLRAAAEAAFSESYGRAMAVSAVIAGAATMAAAVFMGKPRPPSSALHNK